VHCYPTLSYDIPGEAGSPTGDEIDCVQTVGPSSEEHPHAPSMPRATAAISQRSQDPGTHRVEEAVGPNETVRRASQADPHALRLR
jgi:hypothetical protein